MNARCAGFIFLLLFARSSAGQTGIDAVANCQTRSIPVTVVDSHGRPVLTLDQTAFHIHDKSGITLSNVGILRETPRALLMIDVSGSMLPTEKPQKAASVKALADGIVGAAQPKSPFAIMTVAERIGEQADFEATKETLSTIIARVGPQKAYRQIAGQQTALWDALLKGADVYSEVAGNNVIFVISDGGDNKSRVELSTIKNKLLEKRVRIFALVPSETPPATIEERRGPDSMSELSDFSGGRSLLFGGDLAADEQLGNYVYILSSVYYRVDLTFNVALRKKTRLNLQVVTADGKKLAAYYPHELLPCAPEAAK